MKLTGRQKLYMVILVIAGVGLVCDRLFILPQSAKAQVSDETEGLLVQETEPSNFMPEPESKKTLSKRLDRLIPDDRLEAVDQKDIFAVCPAWSHIMTSDGAVKTEQSVRDRFLRNHKLKAVILTDTNTQVYVDDRVICPGDRLDGFTLVDVNETSATFTGQGVRVVLPLKPSK